MNRTFAQHISASILLLYLTVGFLGSLGVITYLFRTPTPSSSYQVPKPLLPTASKIIWTQYKHIPSILKIVVHAHAIVSFPILIEPREYVILLILPRNPAYSSPHYASDASRAPPSA